MVNEINSTAAALAGSVAFTVEAPARKGTDPVDGPAAPEQNSRSSQTANQDAPSDSLTITRQGEDSKDILRQVQQNALASKTTVYYAQDPEDGKMYLYVRDKRTGEDLYRIPHDYLKTAESEVEPVTRVDVRS